ncbi:hypothetical protein NP511_02030 [Natrinema thermotolerans]|uniref:Uncharacterized protein n=1 Tax=Natrinema thermotolerans TaxID=121872 RepID=A0AAF0T5R7_9EURY|nr:hypothetical protein [Natrinema thermotolerans]WPH65839.1 hypothetical protein HJTV4_gp16 [Haloarchaeal virus HJTV-4]QCC60744.1 hypothetical protein DVR14_19725 [Natrinema thermotolerans]QCC61622.1 hypothetical protein DVR14_23855 [Natrinema thermotolerans]WMT07789.1 hypothetical protein NP511_20745 [Natrinema thermotolerans]WMT08421.1 hypothetical protein NP511_02030 [Natrinema thermotolerans]
MSLETTQIPYQRDGDDVVGIGSYRVLETFDGRADEDVREDIREKTEVALKDYPELAGKTVTIGRIDPDEDANAQAFFYNLLTAYHTDRFASLQTVYHELAHLAIFVQHEQGEDVPLSSEEYCSIVAVSRMPVRYLEHDNREDISYLGTPTVPKAEWPEICQRALEYREENGRNSHYIQRCKEWLEVDA